MGPTRRILGGFVLAALACSTTTALLLPSDGGGDTVPLPAFALEPGPRFDPLRAPPQVFLDEQAVALAAPPRTATHRTPNDADERTGRSSRATARTDSGAGADDAGERTRPPPRPARPDAPDPPRAAPPAAAPTVAAPAPRVVAPTEERRGGDRDDDDRDGGDDRDRDRDDGDDRDRDRARDDDRADSDDRDDDDSGGRSGPGGGSGRG